ncbi:Predicted ATPase [Leclercia adecarboxylata]|uniref:Predicted ATPase n=1 Tax=Leclercia adecarboxylata TaxID=83655 RepID=A0A4U9HM34_9ENTR|nr:Predicted ATPase [Leclercia adecarboxylata]
MTSGAAVMCVPMFKQARLVGVLYLENRLMPEVFTVEHSRVVSLLGRMPPSLLKPPACTPNCWRRTSSAAGLRKSCGPARPR